MKGLRILLAASEAYPLAKTGGLGDYVFALAKALTRLGCDVRVLIPGYRDALARLSGRASSFDLAGNPGFDDAQLVQGRLPGTSVRAWLLDCPRLFDRNGGPYAGSDGEPFTDNAERFAVFARAIRVLAQNQGPIDWQPDVVHLHDWQTAPAAALLALEPTRPASVLTIHNLAFRGLFGAEALALLGLPADQFVPDQLEFWGQASFLKAGIRYADRVTTVSGTYAREILQPEFGCGLDGMLRARTDGVLGIRNGIDDEEWNPETDPLLPSGYGSHDLRGKTICKEALRQRFNLPASKGAPVLGYLCRLTDQKMADVVLESLPGLAARGTQVVVMGQGDPATEARFQAAAGALGGSVGLIAGYDEPTAHLLLAGSDILLAPARFEPCGLTQMYAMRYGTVPVASRVGGLAETVVDLPVDAAKAADATGFLFAGETAQDLLAAVDRALGYLRQPFAWRRLMTNGMRSDFSWDAPATRYAALYQEIAPARQSEAPRRAQRISRQPANRIVRVRFARSGPDRTGTARPTLSGSGKGSIDMPKQRITPEDIQQRAYELWERNGRDHGRHLEHWLQAERELEAERGLVAPDGAGATARPAPVRTRAATAKPKTPKSPAPDAGAGKAAGAPSRNSQRTA